MFSSASTPQRRSLGWRGRTAGPSPPTTLTRTAWTTSTWTWTRWQYTLQAGMFCSKPKKWTEHSVFNWPSLQALDADVPLIFISFPSVKDPEWTNHPGEHLLSSSLANYTLTCKGRENKTTCAIVTLANWKWFSQWQDGQVTACHDVTLLLSHSCVCDQVKKRGDDYEEIKQAIGHKMIEQTCKLYPQVLTKEASVIS